MKYAATILLLVTLIPAAVTAAKKPKASPYFVYDRADETIKATMLEGGGELYDPGIASAKAGLWLTWLKFTPGKGDEIYVALRPKAGKAVSTSFGRYAKPTLTTDATGKLWLSYEAFDEKNRQWDIFIRAHLGGGKFGEPQRISPGESNDINHRVSPDPNGGLWAVWQSDRDGQFDILARRIGAKQVGDVEKIATSSVSQWSPSIAVSSDGTVAAAWDEYNRQSYKVMVHRRTKGK